MQKNRLPLIPTAIMKIHSVDEITDNRFKASARLLQSLWRQDQNLKIGTYRTSKGKRRKLGSRLHADNAKQGANFLSPDIAALALRESVYCEPGAIIDQERLWTNLLSSQPLCFNLFGGLKLDLEKGNQFFRHLFPDFVDFITDIYFEHSPGRRNPAFTNDHTAFDVFATCMTKNGQSGFVAFEVKYSETMEESPTSPRSRYDDLTISSSVFKEPNAQALRESPLQQLWREPLLSQSMLRHGLFGEGRFIVLYPEQNNNCDTAINLYRTHLVDSGAEATGFDSVTLETCLIALRAIGDGETADALHRRYLNFDRVEQAIFG